MAFKAKLVVIGTFLSIVSFLTGGYLLDISDVPPNITYIEYLCKDSDNGGWCWKLSDPSEAYPTPYRCYYNHSAPRTYKPCKSGWDLLPKLSNILITPEKNETIFYCEEGDKPIKECTSKDGSVIIRIKNNFGR